MEVTDVNHHVDASSNRVLYGTEVSASAPGFSKLDLQALRLLLSGSSVVDWRRLSFQDMDEVAGFLAANGYDVESETEMARLRVLHERALAYLEQTYELTIPDKVRSPSTPAELFLTASGQDSDAAEQ